MSHASEAKAISAETASLMRANIDRMNALAGFDVVIVCCGNDNQAAYWKQRLDKGKGSVVHAETMVLAVAEDWPGGAGNGILHSTLPLLPLTGHRSAGHSVRVAEGGGERQGDVRRGPG